MAQKLDNLIRKMVCESRKITWISPDLINYLDEEIVPALHDLGYLVDAGILAFYLQRVRPRGRRIELTKYVKAVKSRIKHHPFRDPSTIQVDLQNLYRTIANQRMKEEYRFLKKTVREHPALFRQFNLFYGISEVARSKDIPHFLMNAAARSWLMTGEFSGLFLDKYPFNYSLRPVPGFTYFAGLPEPPGTSMSLAIPYNSADQLADAIEQELLHCYPGWKREQAQHFECRMTFQNNTEPDRSHEIDFHMQPFLDLVGEKPKSSEYVSRLFGRYVRRGGRRQKAIRLALRKDRQGLMTLLLNQHADRYNSPERPDGDEKEVYEQLGLRPIDDRGLLYDRSEVISALRQIDEGDPVTPETSLETWIEYYNLLERLVTHKADMDVLSTFEELSIPVRRACYPGVWGRIADAMVKTVSFRDAGSGKGKDARRSSMIKRCAH